MDFKKYLDKTAKELDREVEKILNQEIKEAKEIDEKLIPLLEAFAASCMGGKRIRGTLVKLGYELGRAHLPGVKAHLEGGGILKIGAAYEIFHASILAHDDIMDQSEERRSKISLYKKVGIAEAITLGDFGFFLAMKIISNPLFAGIAFDTALGQLLDLKKADSVVTAKFKTAKYTISGPLRLGAVLAEANTKMIKLLEEFGENLGIAFQIKDDILDGQSNSLEQAKRYKNKALKLLSVITRDEEMSKLLEQMGGYLIDRKT